MSNQGRVRTRLKIFYVVYYVHIFVNTADMTNYPKRPTRGCEKMKMKLKNV